MPALPVADNCLRVTFDGDYGDSQWANVMHVAYADAQPTAVQCDTIAASLYAAYADNLMPVTSSTSRLLGCTVRDLASEDGAEGTFFDETAGSLSPSENMSANVAAVISWVQPRHYRGGHPRTYLCGMSASKLASTTRWSTAYANDVQAAGAGFLADVDAIAEPAAVGPFFLVLLSYFHNGALRHPPLFSTITAARCDVRVDTQRRRLGRL